MLWGTRRRNLILVIGIIVVIIPTSVILFNFFYDKPSCFDNKQNGDERGVDCGGSCELVCNNETFEPVILWTRMFEVAPNLYNAIAYVENPNLNAGIKNIRYTFKLYDSENTLLFERGGRTKIPPKSIIPIIENGMYTNRLDAKRVSFKFIDEFIFEKEDPLNPVLIVKDEQLSNGDSTRVEASIQNITIYPVSNIKIIVILYDDNDNAVGSSSTIIKEILGNESEQITFTWPTVFEDEISRVEIIPLYENNI